MSISSYLFSFHLYLVFLVSLTLVFLISDSSWSKIRLTFFYLALNLIWPQFCLAR